MATRKVKTPGSFGEPEIVPLFGSKVRPWGSWPETMLQAYGGFPPAPVKVAEYAVPTLPLGSEEDVIEGGAVTVKLKPRVAVEEPSVTATVNVELAAVLAAPEITPLLLSDNPCGSSPDAIDQE